MARRLLHSEISQDIEGFLATGVKRMDSRGNQARTILIQSSIRKRCMSFNKGSLPLQWVSSPATTLGM